MKKISLFAIVFLLLISLSMAAPPFVATTDTGMSIEPVLVEAVKTGATYTFNIHVINQSNGFPLTSGISCYMQLYNSTGNHLVRGYQNVSKEDFDYEFIVNGANFTTGIYQTKFQCNNSVRGGAAEIMFEANPFGVAYTLQRSILYIIYITIAILFFIGFIILGVALPSKNNTDETTGYIIAISNLKYLKLFFLFFAYLTLVLISYLLWIISYSHLVGLEYMSSLLQYTFYILAFGILIVFVVGTYIFIANWIRDTKVADMLLRGLSVK